MSKSRLHTFEFKKNTLEKIFLTSEQGMYTYKDLARFTAYLKNIIGQQADSLKWPVAFLSESSDMLIFGIAACWNLGIPIIPLSPKLSQVELESAITKLNPSLIFCDTLNRSRVSGDDVVHMDENFFLNAFTFDIRGIDLKERIVIKESDIAGYFFTSGTSGNPKIVPIKRRQVLSAAKASSENFKPDANHFWLLCLPLNHVGGISIILRSIIYDSAIYRMGQFREDMIKEFLSENLRFQAASLVPTMLKRLLDDPLFKTHKKFKAILLGGGPTTKELLRKSVERGIPVVSSYGMTETCAQIVTNSLVAPSGIYTPLQSVGKPFPPNNLQVRDENQKVLGKNQSGTIWLKGPQIFDGYYDKEHNEGRFDKKGWFNTGDYGHLNGFGQLFIESRREDLIITGGENVNPIDVEKAIKKIDSIKDVVVLGIPNDEWGQIVTAFITLSNGKVPNIDELRDQLRSELADFKLPKELRVVSEIPRTELGKVKRAELLKFS